MLLLAESDSSMRSSANASQLESDLLMSSSGKSSGKILGVITPARAEAFLTRLANRNLEKDIEKLKLAYPEMTEPLEGRPQQWGDPLYWVQIYLRSAWTAPDDRTRDWYLYELRRHYRDATTEASLSRENPKLAHDFFSAIPAPGIQQELVDERFLQPPPEKTPFEAAVSYFQDKIGNRAKHCAHDDCPEPYFIAEKRWQKFCSEACAGPANRESKRKWWKDNRAKGGIQ